MFRKIKNLIRWFKVIWNDYDWDYEALLIILETKLKFMAEAFNSDKAVAEDSEIHGKQMEKCANICRYIIEDKHYHFYDELYAKWGEPKASIDDKTLELTISHSKVKTVLDEQLFEKELEKTILKADQEIQDKINVLFGIIKNNLTKWWD